MTGIRALLHSHGITDNSMKPEHQNVTAEHEANESEIIRAPIRNNYSWRK